MVTANLREFGVSAGGIGVGVGSTIAIRRQFDQVGETSIFRPSVLWGAVTGLGAIGAALVMGDRSVMWEFVEDYGEAALASGILSAFTPKCEGSDQFPTLPQ